MRFDDTARLGFRSRLYLLGGGAGKVFGAGVFAQGLGVNYLIAGILQAISRDWLVRRMTSRAVTGSHLSVPHC